MGPGFNLDNPWDLGMIPIVNDHLESLSVSVFEAAIDYIYIDLMREFWIQLPPLSGFVGR